MNLYNTSMIRSHSAAMPPEQVGIIPATGGYLNLLRVQCSSPELLSPDGAYRQSARSEAVDLIGLSGGAVLALLNRDFHDDLGLRTSTSTIRVASSIMPFLSRIDSVTHGRMAGRTPESGPNWASLHTLTQFTLRAARAAAFGNDLAFSTEYAADSGRVGEGLGVRQAASTHDAITGDFQREVGTILNVAATNEGRGWVNSSAHPSRIDVRTMHVRKFLGYHFPVQAGGHLALRDFTDSIFDIMGDTGPVIAELLEMPYQPGRGLAQLEAMGVATPPNIGAWSTEAARLSAMVGPPPAES